MTQETTSTRFHLSIAFYGNYKPLHLPSADIETLRRYIRAKVNDQSIIERALKLISDFTQQRKAGIGIVSACHEGNGFSVSIREGIRDNWLDSLTDEFEEHPQIDYKP